MRICTFGFVRLDSTGIWWGASLGSRAYCCRVPGYELSWTRKYALNPRLTAHAFSPARNVRAHKYLSKQYVNALVPTQGLES